MVEGPSLIVLVGSHFLQPGDVCGRRHCCTTKLSFNKAELVVDWYPQAHQILIYTLPISTSTTIIRSCCLSLVVKCTVPYSFPSPCLAFITSSMMVQLEARLQYITGLVITLPEADTEPREGEEIVQVTGTEETVNHSL